MTDDLEKDVEAKKPLPPSSANYTSEQFFQPSRSALWQMKKNPLLCRSGNAHQQGSTPVIRVNITIVKKDKKAEKNISLVEYFSYHKKSHYVNKCSDK